MKTKRISDKMEMVLNEQMTREAKQAQVYLAYASWAEINGFPGIAAFLYKHSNEERQHMFKFLKFINDRGGKCQIQAIAAPPNDPKGMKNCLQKTLQHEIDKYGLAAQQPDHANLYALDRDVARASQEISIPRENEF